MQLENIAFQEGPEGQGTLAVPSKLNKEWVIRAKDFALVPLNPTNCYIGLLYLKKPSNFDHFWQISTNF